MTFHVDEKLLNRVVEATGATSKTHAIDLALREIDRRAELARLAREGLGLSAAELRESYDPASVEPPRPLVSVNYAKSRSGR